MCTSKSLRILYLCLDTETPPSYCFDTALEGHRMKMAEAHERLEAAQGEISAVAGFFEDMGLESSAFELDEAQNQIEEVLATIEELQASM